MKDILALLFFLFLVQGLQAQTTPNPALLVGEKSGAALSIIDPATLEVVARVPANENPHEVATDGKHAFVSNSRLNRMTIIDLQTQKQVEGLDLDPLGPIHSIEMADGKLFIGHEATRVISRYDPVAGKIEQVLGTGIPGMHMIRPTEDAEKIFATSMSAGLAAIIARGESGWEITTIPTGPRAEGLDISPDGQELWVNNVNEKTISIIDVAQKQEIEKIQLPTAFSNRLKFTLDGRYVFVAELRDSWFLVLDAKTRKEVKRIEVGGGTEGILMAPDGKKVFVAVSRANKVVVVDLDTLEVTGEILGLVNPDGMAWAESM